MFPFISESFLIRENEKMRKKASSPVKFAGLEALAGKSGHNSPAEASSPMVPARLEA